MRDDFKAQLLNDVTYASPRGTMVLFLGTRFIVRFPYTGVFPGMPLMSTDPNLIQETKQRINSVLSLGRNLYLGTGDSYWFGKRLGKVADLVEVADQIGYLTARDTLLADLKSGLSDWLTADDGTSNFFYYDPVVGTLIGWVSQRGVGLVYLIAAEILQATAAIPSSTTIISIMATLLRQRQLLPNLMVNGRKTIKPWSTCWFAMLQTIMTLLAYFQSS